MPTNRLNWILGAILVMNVNQATAMRLDESIGAVAANLVTNTMTGTAQSAKITAVGKAWVDTYLVKSYHVPTSGVTLTSQEKTNATYDGISIVYTVNGTNLLIKQTIGASVISFGNQGTAGKTNGELEAFLEEMAGTVLNSGRNFDFAFSGDAEGYKVFNQIIPPETRMNNWVDDVVVLVMASDVYFVASKRLPEGESNNDMDTSPSANKTWFPMLNYGGKVKQFVPQLLEAQVTLKPEALEVSPGILTAFVRLPEDYPVKGIISAFCDGALYERMMPNEDGTEMIIKFRRQDIENALAQVGESLDTNFVVRGVWRGTTGTNFFEGTASIKKIVGAKEKEDEKEKKDEKKKDKEDQKEKKKEK